MVDTVVEVHNENTTSTEDTNNTIQNVHEENEMSLDIENEFENNPASDIDTNNDGDENVNQTSEKKLQPYREVKLKEGMMIKYKDTSNGRNKIVQLGKRAGKATGKYKGEWNVRSQQGVRSVVNFEKDVSNLEILGQQSSNELYAILTEELNLSETFIAYNKTEVTNAKIKELESWRQNDVYDEVPFENQQCISSKWVLKPKIVNNQHITKARLVLKGYEEDDCFRTDAPCCRRESIRLMLAITATMKWDLNSVDFKTAFLQGHYIEREVYMIPPKEAGSDKVWKIKKAVYGLNDGPRQWYVRLRDTIMKTGCTMNSLDPGLFTLHQNSILCGIIITYVDDLLWSGNSQFREMVISKLIKLLEISVQNFTAFDYIGIQLKQTEDKSITLSQHAYVESVDMISIQDDSDKDRPLTKQELKSLRRAAGQLNWASNISRPDMGFGACDVATSVPNATVSTLIKANKWIRHLKNTQGLIKFPCFHKLEDLKITVYSDASYKNLPNGASQGGQLVFLTDGVNCAPILWHSRKVKRVVKNTLGAETLSLCQGAESGFLIAKIAWEIIHGKNDSQLPVTCITDNLSLYQSAHTTGHLIDDRLIIDMAIIREMVSKREIKLEWVPGSDQISDILTKRGASNKKLSEILERGTF